MPWIRREVVDPPAGTVILKFSVLTKPTPHTGLVGVVGIFASSTADVDLEFRRMNYNETVVRTWWKIFLAARRPVFIRSTDDPFEPKIGIPEAGDREKIDVRNVQAITGRIFVAVEVAGGPTDVEVGEVW